MSGAGPVAAFVACAERYCGLIESAEELARGEFVWRAGELLAELYVAGLHLPAVDATDDDVEREITHEEAFQLFEMIRRKLGDLDEYKGIFDPYDLKEALSSSSLADDLTDVYRDIKNGLLALERRRAAGCGPMGMAVWLGSLGGSCRGGDLRDPLDYAQRRPAVDQPGGPLEPRAL